jgi:PilZ domain
MHAKADPFADQRAAPRSSLMLRTAKVVCQSGEYLCLVRDVSATGAGLRFFHAVPPEPRIFLELANGQIHPIERVWSRENEAGYRFASEVDVAEFIAERSDHPHRAIRLRLERAVLVTAEGQDSRAMLTDISRTGARIEAERRWPLQAFVRLELAGFPIRYGHVRWREGTAHGIVFQNALPLGDLAQHLLALQPFAEQSGPNGWAIRAA